MKLVVFDYYLAHWEVRQFHDFAVLYIRASFQVNFEGLKRLDNEDHQLELSNKLQ